MTTKNFDLEDRTAKFGEDIIIFCKTIEDSYVTRPLISQIVRSATSVGANYMEANAASSKKDFMPFLTNLSTLSLENFALDLSQKVQQYYGIASLFSTSSKAKFSTTYCCRVN